MWLSRWEISFYEKKTCQGKGGNAGYHFLLLLHCFQKLKGVIINMPIFGRDLTLTRSGLSSKVCQFDNVLQRLSPLDLVYELKLVHNEYED